MDFIRNASIFSRLRKKQNVVNNREMSATWREQFNVLTHYNIARVPFILNGIHSSGFETVTGAVNETRLNGVRILDVGCGGGILSEDLAKLGADVVGVDINPEAIADAKQHQALDTSIANNLKYVCESIYQHEKENFEKYDVVVLSEVIEHVPNEEKEAFLTSCIKNLRPGGALFVTTPGRTFLSRFTLIFIGESIGITPKGTHEYNELISEADLIGMIGNRRCEVRSVVGFKYQLHKKKFVVCRSKAYFYGIHALKIEDK